MSVNTYDYSCDATESRNLPMTLAITGRPWSENALKVQARTSGDTERFSFDSRITAT